MPGPWRAARADATLGAARSDGAGLPGVVGVSRGGCSWASLCRGCSSRTGRSRTACGSRASCRAADEAPGSRGPVRGAGDGQASEVQPGPASSTAWRGRGKLRRRSRHGFLWTGALGPRGGARLLTWRGAGSCAWPADRRAAAAARGRSRAGTRAAQDRGRVPGRSSPGPRVAGGLWRPVAGRARSAQARPVGASPGRHHDPARRGRARAVRGLRSTQPLPLAARAARAGARQPGRTAAEAEGCVVASASAGLRGREAPGGGRRASSTGPT
jgi:hypothetical protein